MSTYETDTAPRIYVASLSDYNNGNLLGVWIELDGKDADDVQEAVNEMLRRSRYPNVELLCHDCDGIGEVSECSTCSNTGTVPSAEEWAIHDYEGFESIRLSESESFDHVVEFARLIEEHGEAFAAWWDNGTAGDIASAEDDFRDAYAGSYRSLEDWAEEFLTDTDALSQIPDHLRFYFDFEKWARDAEMGGDIWTAEGGEGVLVFWNH